MTLRNKKGQFNKGIHPETQFKKRHKTWNKGTKGIVIAWNKGKKMPKEYCQNISKRQKGKKPSCAGWNLGKHNTAEANKKNSDSQKIRVKEGRHNSYKGGKPKCLDCGNRVSDYKSKRCMKCSCKYKVGEKSSNWKGGIAPINNIIRSSLESKLWQDSIFGRDGYTCQKCELKGVYVIAHHILNFAQYPELRFAIDNGITLCRLCHKQFHKKYGIKNNNLEQIKEFLRW